MRAGREDARNAVVHKLVPTAHNGGIDVRQTEVHAPKRALLLRLTLGVEGLL